MGGNHFLNESSCLGMSFLASYDIKMKLQDIFSCNYDRCSVEISQKMRCDEIMYDLSSFFFF